MTATTDARTGHGASIQFSSQSPANPWKLQSIQLPTEQGEMAEIVDLSMSSFLQKLPPDVLDPGEGVARVFLTNDQDIPAAAGAETITITFRQETGETTAANIAGTGFVFARGGATFETNQGRVAEIRFAFDGKTGPAFTPAT